LSGSQIKPPALPEVHDFGPRGTHLNLGLPGTGISLRLRLDKLSSFDPGRAETPDDPTVRAEIIQYKSVDVSALGSESIARVSDLLKKLHRQRHVVSLAIAQAEDDFSRTQRCTKRLLWLCRRLAPQAVAQRQDYEQTCEERLALLKEIKKTLILDVDFAISNEAKAVFKNIVSAFDRIRSCTRIWDITSAQTIDRYRTRKAATHELNMQPVCFTRTDDFLLATEFQPPRFTNANGADLLLYPAFVAYRRVLRPRRNQPPMHQPALVAAPVTDNDGNVRGSLGGDVKAQRVQREIAVQVPANSDVTEFEGSCEASTHNEGTIAL
jgi:hypothetical protein